MDRRVARRESRRADRAEELRRRTRISAMTIVPRRYLPARMIGAVWQARWRPSAPCSQIEQARYLIERKRQLAHHDDKRNREEVKAVVHRRVTQNAKKAYAEAKLVTYNDDSPT